MTEEFGQMMTVNDSLGIRFTIVASHRLVCGLSACQLKPKKSKQQAQERDKTLTNAVITKLFGKFVLNP